MISRIRTWLRGGFGPNGSPQVWRGVIGLCLLSVLGSAGGHARDGVPGPVPARLVAVIDGDTIDVEARIWIDQAVTTRVRLAGIDAPELNGKCADERTRATRARQAVVDLIAGEDVMLHDIRYGKYAGRVLARVVTADRVDVAQALLGRDLVRAYDGGRRGSWCVLP